MDDLASAILGTAQRLGINPVDLGTAISYETGGTFDPWKRGPTTQWGTHRGLIQWGEPQAKQYGVYQGMPTADQMLAVEHYLRDRGVKPGMGLMDVYSAINAGRVGLYNRSDASNGGAPGTVADKVNYQMGAHRDKAIALLNGQAPAAPVMLAQADTPGPANAPSAPAAAPVAPGSMSPDAAARVAGIPAQIAALTAPAQPEAPLASLAGLFVNQAQRQQQKADEQAAEQARRRALFDTPPPFGRA